MAHELKKPPHSNRGVNPPSNVPSDINQGHHRGVLEPSPGVDWITALTDKEAVGLDWYSLWAKATGHSGRQAHLGRDWSRWGYAGREMGDSRWGVHPDSGWLLTAWGEVAQKLWLQIAPTASKVTRIDLRVDVHLNDPLEDLAKSYYEHRPTDNRRKYGLIANSRGGTTLYIGSRQSDFFGRCYDKGAQLGDDPGYWWRYELQINKPKSHQLSRKLVDRFKLEGVAAWNDVIGYVYQWFDGRGVTPIFKRMPTKVRLEPLYKVTTVDRKISWLRSQVRPTVEQLIKAGYGAEVITALELSEYVQMALFDEFQNLD